MILWHGNGRIINHNAIPLELRRRQMMVSPSMVMRDFAVQRDHNRPVWHPRWEILIPLAFACLMGVVWLIWVVTR